MSNRARVPACRARARVPAMFTGFLLLFCGGATATADTIRVIASQASVRLQPDPNSQVIETVAAGVVLEIRGLQGNWYVVVLPSAQGAQRIGYISVSDVEVFGTQGQPLDNPLDRANPVRAAPPAQVSSVDTGVEISAIYGANKAFPLSPVEPFAQGLVLGGLRSVRIDAESNRQRVIGVNVAGQPSRFVLVFTEVLYHDFGESRVSGVVLLGSTLSGGRRVSVFSPRQTITYRPTLLEWTSGIRVPFPAGTWRVRPYVAGGAGLLSLKQEATGAETSLSERTNDFTYHVDVGTRVFVTGWFGVAPEFRIVHIPDGTFYRVLVNAVFRVG